MTVERVLPLSFPALTHDHRGASAKAG